MMPSGLDAELVEELSAIAVAEDCELIHVDYQGGTLRLVLDREEEDGGVTHEHCSRVSRQTSALLDAYDFGRGRYTLEVSSPGLDRPMYRDSDYQRFAGRLARIRYRDPKDGQAHTIVARLGGLNGDQVQLEPDSASSSKAGSSNRAKKAASKRLSLPLSAIEQANLEVEL